MNDFFVTSLDLVQDNFLVVASAHGDIGNLYQIDLRSGAMTPLLRTTSFRPVTVAFDSVERVVYWTDVQQRLIGKAKLGESQRNSLIIFKDSNGTLFKKHVSGTAATIYYNILHFLITHA